MRHWMTIAALAACLAACGGGEEKKHDPAKSGTETGKAAKESAKESAHEEEQLSPEEQMAKQAEETRKSLKEMNKGKEIKAVEPARIKALLPESIAGAKRGSVESQHQDMMGMDISTVEARYRTESGDGPGYHVKITDIGNLSGAMAGPYTMWATMSFERENGSRYEKTVKVAGFPGVEEYDSEGKDGKLQALVAKRFVVEVDGNDCTIEQIRAAMDALDLGKLKALVE